MRDIGLRKCSVTARGVWMDLLAIAAGSEEPGYLVYGGEPLTIADLSRITGIRRSTLLSCMAELEKSRVFSRDGRNAIYSRRMVREAREYKQNVEAGTKGGNPMLLGADISAVSERNGSDIDADVARNCDKSAAHTARNRSDELSNNNNLDGSEVNPPVKADKDLDKDSDKKKGNPDGFPDARAPNESANVVHIAEHRKPSEPPAKPPPKRRGVEMVKPLGTDEQLRTEDHALRLWNQLAAVSNVREGSMTPDRRAKLRLRLADGGGLDGWHIALKAVEQSDLWQGRIGRGWKPIFDDILSRTKFRKLLEGGYANSRPAGKRDPKAYLYDKFGIPDPDKTVGSVTIDMEDV